MRCPTEISEEKINSFKMIISHKHQFIFLKSVKTAGTSFEIALSRFLGKEDVVTPIAPDDENIRKKLTSVGPQNFRKSLRNFVTRGTRRDIKEILLTKKLPKRYWNHCPAKIVRQEIGEKIWNDYKKVSIIRDPWDRLISSYFYATRIDKNPTDIEKWLLRNPGALTQNLPIYTIPPELQSVVDAMIIYENFEETIQALEKEIKSLSGLWETFMGIKAKSNFRDPQKTKNKVFDDFPNLAMIVAEFSPIEIQDFGYRFI